MKRSSQFIFGKFDFLWILLLVILLLSIILGWPNPASGAFQPEATPLPLPTTTPIPAEFLETADQTNGIICGSVVLVLIIVGGTVGVLRRKNGKTTS